MDPNFGLNRPANAAVVLGRRTGTRIRLLARPEAPAPTSAPANRRKAERVPTAETPWADTGRLRTGHEVRVVDISTCGVHFAAPVRLHVGSRVEVCLTELDTDARLVLGGVVSRCQVASLDPVTYAGALEFDREIDAGLLQPFTVIAAPAV
ncbi:MAG: PilZ domain-containing protein [Vicinamibacterales bacterium]